MRKLFTLLVLVICIFVISACNFGTLKGKLNQSKQSAVILKEEVPVDFIPQDLTIVSIGDSLTEGVGDSTDSGGYLPYLQSQLEMGKNVNHADFYNFGVKGNRTDQLIKRLHNEGVQTSLKKADIVIITIGGNDIMKVVRDNFSHLKIEHFDNAKKDYVNNLDTILQTVRETNNAAMIVLVGLYNPFFTWFSDLKELDEIVETWNDASELIVGTYEHAYFVKIADLFQFYGESLLYTDYFHPNDKGYELIADRLYETLDSDVISELSKQKVVTTQGETNRE